MPSLFNADGTAVHLISTILFEGFIMRPTTSPLEHLTAFAIVFAAGFLSAASFVAYMERVRRKAVLDYYKRTNSESNLSVQTVPKKES